MYYSKDIESFGRGLQLISRECDAVGVRYEFILGKLGFSVVFYRPNIDLVNDKVNDKVNDRVNDKVNDRMNDEMSNHSKSIAT